MTRETLKFEHIDTDPDLGSNVFVPDGYGGLHWDNMACSNTTTSDPDSGYYIGTHSGKSIAFNGGALDASFSADAPFTLKSGWFTGAFHNEDVTFTAFSGGVEVGHKTFHVLNSAQTFIKFGKHFANIDSVTVSTGGLAFSQVVIDDLKVVTNVTAAPLHDPLLDGQPADQSLDTSPMHALELLGIDHSLSHHADAWMLC